MNALDLDILFSYSETFPNVVAEVMTCGMPCIISGAGDAGLFVWRNGWVVPPRNSKALANAIFEAIAELIDSAKWKQRQQGENVQIIDEFCLELMVADYKKAWEVK